MSDKIPVDDTQEEFIQDKYSSEIAYLNLNPHRIPNHWSGSNVREQFRGENGAGTVSNLFQYCSDDSLYHSVRNRIDDSSRSKLGEESCTGCLTQIRSNSRAYVTIKDSIVADLTELIKADEGIPSQMKDVKPEHLERFAYWQRRLDREIRGL